MAVPNTKRRRTAEEPFIDSFCKEENKMKSRLYREYIIYISPNSFCITKYNITMNIKQ